MHNYATPDSSSSRIARGNHPGGLLDRELGRGGVESTDIDRGASLVPTGLCVRDQGRTDRVRKLRAACAHMTKRPESPPQIAEMTEEGVSERASGFWMPPS